MLAIPGGKAQVARGNFAWPAGRCLGWSGVSLSRGLVGSLAIYTSGPHARLPWLKVSCEHTIDTDLPKPNICRRLTF